MPPAAADDPCALYLQEALRERGIQVDDISSVATGYCVSADGQVVIVPAPLEGARILLWAMQAADEVARSVG